jgi:hypothetical protein
MLTLFHHRDMKANEKFEVLKLKGVISGMKFKISADEAERR